MNDFLASEYTPASQEEAAFHVIPAPYEKTVSYGTGTARGPQAILDASQQLEGFYRHSSPGSGGIYTFPAVDVSGPPEEALDNVGRAVVSALDNDALPILLGGEHTVTYGAVRAVHERYDGDFGVVQFDAHADLRDSYEGTNWSHACVMRRIYELDVPVFQIGVRSLSREEDRFRAANGIPHCSAGAIMARGTSLPPLSGKFPGNVYVTFDVDAFDASLMPATGTPEPGGLFWWDAIRLLDEVLEGRRLLGADVVELAPNPTLFHCDYTAAKLVYTLMGYKSQT